jgi:hypothetical protein
MPFFSDYHARIERLAAELIAKYSAEYLRQVDSEEFLDYLVSQLSWDPLE